MSYNKLVRDKIPQIIEKNEGRSCKTRILEPDETPILFFHTNAEKPQVFPKRGGQLREL